MFKFEKIIETAASRMIPVAINKNRCSKLRSPLSQCNRCIEICPVDGISIDKSGITLSNNCIYCGLCASHCPTNAIFIQEPTERNLYNYIEDLGEKDNTIILSCSRNEEATDTHFKVPCLGSLSFEFLFGIDVLPFHVNIVFEEKKCQECEVKTGIENYFKTLGRVRNLKERLSIKANSIKHMEKVPVVKKNKASKDVDINEERREFLFSIFKSAKKLPNYAIKYILGSDENQGSKAVQANPTVEKFPILRKGLNRVDKAFIDVEINEYLKPTLVKQCSFCRACTMLCPMGALKYIEEGDNLEIRLIKEVCIGCGLCVEVCYHKSLKMEPRTVKDFLSKDRPLLISGKKQQCKKCKKTIMSSENMEICSSCLKKANLNWR